jgi:DMSO/TMAO reductase YedYZ heme-binding membrane subunit
MIFLISLTLAILFVGVSAKHLQIHPVPFYLAAAAISAGVIFIAWNNILYDNIVSSPVIANWVWPVFSRGGLAGSLFVLVMITGALPNDSFLIKKLMPVRGQLSILACILTFGHNLAYGKIFFGNLAATGAKLSLFQKMAARCSCVMLLIMLPLFVTSFPAVRQKMQAKRWKQLQRLAYLFYGLLYCHILLLTLPYAMEGKRTYQITVLAYSVVFLGYGVCRISKAVATRRKLLENYSAGRSNAKI